MNFQLKIFGVVHKLLSNLVKMPDRAILSWLVVGVMRLSKCAKFHNERSMDFENIWGGTQTLT